MPDPYLGAPDESEEEQKRLDEARRKTGLPIGRPMPPAPPVSAPASSIGFTKGWSPDERAKQAAAHAAFLRNRR